MNTIRFLFFCCMWILLPDTGLAQHITEYPVPHKTSLRGMSVVDAQTVWVSGSNGMVGRTVDGGNHWEWNQVKGFEKIEFRDIEAFDRQSAIVMGIGEPAYILRTIDGGKSWQVVFKDTTAGMFLDAMMFWNSRSGMVIGDPVDGRFFIARTFDGGVTWKRLPADKLPEALPGEALFAASGSNIGKASRAEAVFVTGGTHKRFFNKQGSITLPINDTSSSSGPNSIAVKNKKTMMIAGGDYLKKDQTSNNCFITLNGGKDWFSPKIPPSGYRSCIDYLRNKTWITCGLNGVDITFNEGETWENISSTGFHTLRASKDGSVVYFAGQNKTGRLKMADVKVHRIPVP
ncbi:MAG TPA: YCF48-related protein [Ferruginibacter sp.]|nr:YCF48-related protein [Ferruginibacter sp.]